MNLAIYRKGFTLTELITVVAIISILAALAVPSFTEIINNQRIKNASFELFASLLVARSEAIKRNDDVTIAALPGGWQSGWTITSTSADGTVVIKNHADIKKIIISGAPASLVYKRTGRINAAGSTNFQFDIDPVNSKYIRCISIDLSGLPKTAKGACS